VKKRSALILLVFNGLLLSAAWVLALVAYPRLPGRIPLWLDIFGGGIILTQKSPWFFVYPAVQTLFCVLFVGFVRRRTAGKPANPGIQLIREQGYLSLIFFNMIFIHLLSSLVLLAHNIVNGINRFYFFALFGIILILFPYFRLRARILKK